MTRTGIGGAAGAPEGRHVLGRPGAAAAEADPDRRRLLDLLGADGWPPVERVDVAGWRLRAAQGVTLRANSALPPAEAEQLTLDERLGDVRRFYAERGLTARVQVSDPRLDAALADRGWTSASSTAVMSGPVPPPLSGGAAEVEVNVSLAAAPDADWLACWWAVDGRGGPGELEVAQQCLGAITAPTAYVTLRTHGEVVAVGRGVLQQGWLGVFAMAVLPTSRRRGLGRHLLGALGEWGARGGAHRAYLQVFTGNTAAQRLYARAGFSQAHAYSYRSANEA